MELLKAFLKAITLVGIAVLITGIIVLLVNINPIYAIIFTFAFIVILLTTMFFAMGGM